MALESTAEHLSPRAAFLFGVGGVALLVFQTTVVAWLDPWGYGPDLCLILVIYSGLHLPITSGAALVVGWGLLKDAAGGSILGFYAGIFLGVFLLANLTRQKLDPAAPWYEMIVVFIFIFLSGAFTVAALAFFGRPFDSLPSSWTSPVTIFLISTLFSALVGPLLFWVLDKIRAKVFKPVETES